MDPEIIVQSVLSGAAAGGIYALMAIGFGIVYRTTRVFNFAQGGFGALGAYLAFNVFVTWHQPFLLAVVVGCLGVGALAVLVERLALRPLYERGELYTFVSTIGLGFVIQSGIQLLWSPVPKVMPSVFGDRPIEIAGLRIVPEVIAILGISLGLAGCLSFLLARTKVGIAMRASAQDRSVAGLLGIRVDRMFSLAFALSGIVGALGGMLIAPITILTPTMGLSLGLPGFIAALVGGLGSMRGAVVGGIILGVGQGIAVFIIDPRYRDVALYAVLALIVLMRPSGLFGQEQVEGRQA